MFRSLRRLLLNARPKTRLRREQVMDIAAEAAQAAHVSATFAILSVREIKGRLTWIASTATKGSGWRVSVDDATGELGPMERWGVR